MKIAFTDAALPARVRFERTMTDVELLEFCAVNDALRVEREPNGELLLMTPAGFGTSRINLRIARFLDEGAEGDGRGVATGSDGGYTLPDSSMRAPDAAWVAKDRLGVLSAEDQARFAPICPDFILEIRSPSDRVADLEAKMEQWMANGVRVAWMIDPKQRTVTIYRAGEAPEVLVDPSSVQGSGCVRGFELVMSRVWG